jgi:polyhydroxybutyrate depolymerase
MLHDSRWPTLRSRWRRVGLVVSGFALTLTACSKSAPQMSEFAYPAAVPAPCPVAAPPRSDDEKTASGVGFSVRAPANYNAAYRHPLLVVYAPAGYGRRSSERYYAMTHAATAAGYIVVYPDHVRLSAQALDVLGSVPSAAASKWCIDPARVFFMGHSDGGSISMGVSFLGKSAIGPAAIVASGAGIRGGDLARYRCPRPTAIRLMHSANDERFPGFGVEAADWWAKCNGCGARPPRPDGEGCYDYSACAATTQYCVSQGPHAEWPATPTAVLQFLSRAPASQLK